MKLQVLIPSLFLLFEVKILLKNNICSSENNLTEILRII